MYAVMDINVAAVSESYEAKKEKKRDAGRILRSESQLEPKWLVNWEKKWHLLHTACRMQQSASWKESFLYVIRSAVSLGFVPNRKLAAPPPCSCFSVPEQREAAAAGGTRWGCCVSVTGYYWASAPLCVFVPVSELWQGRAEAWQFLVRASGKLLSSSWFSGNIVSAHQEWSETQEE